MGLSFGWPTAPGRGLFSLPMRDWEAYLDDRAARGVTVIQVGLAPGWAGALPTPPGGFPSSGSRAAAPARPWRRRLAMFPIPSSGGPSRPRSRRPTSRGLYVAAGRHDGAAQRAPCGQRAAELPGGGRGRGLRALAGGAVFGLVRGLFAGLRFAAHRQEGQSLQDLVGRELVRTAPRHLDHQPLGDRGARRDRRAAWGELAGHRDVPERPQRRQPAADPAAGARHGGADLRSAAAGFAAGRGVRRESQAGDQRRSGLRRRRHSQTCVQRRCRPPGGLPFLAFGRLRACFRHQRDLGLGALRPAGERSEKCLPLSAAGRLAVAAFER